MNQVIWENVIKDAFVCVVQKNIAIGVLYTFMFALGIFMAGLLIEFIRTKIAKALKISALSDRIVKVLDMIMAKLFVLLR